MAETLAWQIDRDEANDCVWVRSASAGEPGPDDWRQRLLALLRTVHRVELVGAKRLTREGRVFSMGEFVIHPKGFHHLGQGVLGHAYRFPEEVDTVAGGVFVIDRAAFDAVGERVLAGPLGAMELGLALRARGGRCLVAPQVVVNDAVSPEPEAQETETAAFEQRWGFDWRAADLDTVRHLYADSGLLWHQRFHAAGMPYDKYEARPTHTWKAYDQVQVYHQRADHIVQTVAQVCSGPRVLDLGCGDGLFSHLLAQQGLAVVGIDPEPEAVAQATQSTANQFYPGTRPTFTAGHGEALDLPDADRDAVVMLDVIEHLPNPVATLREVHRVLKPGGICVIVTPSWQYGGWSDPFYHVAEYSPEELKRQVSAGGGLEPVHVGHIGGVYRDVVLAARKPANQ